MQGRGGSPFDPAQPPLGDEEAMREWWQQLGQAAEPERPQHRPVGEEEAEAPSPPPAAPRSQSPRGARRGLFAELSPDDLARAFVLGEVLGSPRSRRGRR